VTTLAPVDVPCEKAVKSATFRVWDNVSEGSILVFLDIPEFPYDTTQDKPQVASARALSLIINRPHLCI